MLNIVQLNQYMLFLYPIIPQLLLYDIPTLVKKTTTCSSIFPRFYSILPIETETITNHPQQGCLFHKFTIDIWE